MIFVLSSISIGLEATAQYTKILNQMFLKTQNFQVKYIAIDRKIC